MSASLSLYARNHIKTQYVIYGINNEYVSLSISPLAAALKATGGICFRMRVIKPRVLVSGGVLE
jgi:hypothetical protein